MTSTRRDFIVVTSIAGAGLALGCRMRPEADGAPAPVAAPERLNFWLAIEPDGGVELAGAKLEMGQGITTALTVMVAEELDLEPAAIRIRTPLSNERLPERRLLETSSSDSVATTWLPVRTAAAAARVMLVGAAAARWGVPAAECEVRAGRVVHRGRGLEAGFGELAADAARQPVPERVELRDRASFRRIGRPTARVEGPEIVTGRIRFSCDVRRPGQRYAVIARPPSWDAPLLSLDDTEARSTPGVERVLPVDTGIAVVAETTAAALAGRRALKVEWGEGPLAGFDSAGFSRALGEALDAPRIEEFSIGARGAVTVERRGRELAWDAPEVALAEYETAFQTHAPMEPPNALVELDAEGRCEIWCGTQWPTRTAEAVARRFELGRGGVVIHSERMGGSFGRKEAPDFVLEAVAVARGYGAGPVQLFWSRDDDLQRGYYHPASRHRLAARLEHGRVAAWRHRVASPSIEGQWRLIRKQLGVAIPRAEASGAWNPPYAFDDFLVEYADPPCPIPLGFWRSIEIGNNTFAVECFVDELAHAAGRDPIEFRLAHLGESLVSHFAEQPFDLARLRAVYELAAERSGWGERLPEGRGRGVAGLVFDGVTACVSVADVTVAEGDVKVDRIVCALDCGTVVNPLGLEGNAESALAWGLSALRSEITFAAGHAQQTSPLDYEILRFHQMPAVEIHTVASDEPPSGTGEIPAPTVAPAVFNAIFAATGKRLRRLPLKPGDLS